VASSPGAVELVRTATVVEELSNEAPKMQVRIMPDDRTFDELQAPAGL
jgi:hypothetical protein